ncbi:MAG: tetratricopeptide repeat protein [Clostridia bacterium]|nr:tetratricopeptide repeat protein [Clostridia bacterium]
MNGKLEFEDYLEPACPLCTTFYDDTPPVAQINISRVKEKLDEYLSHNDYAGGERHLKYWIDEARAGRDGGGELFIQNELMGLYRKTGRKNDAYDAMNNALALTEALKLHETTTEATTFVNAATVLKAFGESQKAIPLYERARVLYEKLLKDSDAKLGGLYNNMALALCDAGRFDEATELFGKAIEVMKKVEYGELEQAITYLNMANVVEAQKGLEDGEGDIEALLDRAKTLLLTPTVPHNGYYAFVCEKCAPTFGYYGHFFDEKFFKEEAEKIYARA